MRVTTWNCLCGDVSDRLSDLAPLCSDLITLQECRQPASDSASVIWRGTLPRQGVAVVSTAAGRCCTNPHWPARCQPTGFSPADAIRHWSAEGGHPIEDFAAEDHLTPLPGWAPGAKAISDDGFVSEERVLHPALTMVP